MDVRVDPDSSVGEVKGARRISTRRILRWSLLALVVLAIFVFAFRYWQHARRFVSTDDGYINANIVQIAAQVSGPVIHVDVRDQQHVTRGQPLFEIDPRPFQIALDAARAALDQAHQSVDERTAASAQSAEATHTQAETAGVALNAARSRCSRH